MSFKKIDEMFSEKTLLKKAMAALEEKQEIQINLEAKKLTKTLSKKLEDTNFFVVCYSHYDDFRFSVLNSTNADNKIIIDFIDGKISVDGNTDDEARKVLDIVRKWIKDNVVKVEKNES